MTGPVVDASKYDEDVLANLVDRLEYVLRSNGGRNMESTAGADLTAAAPNRRQLLQIRGIGRATKDPRRLLDRPHDAEAPWRIPTEDLLAGLHAQGVPVVFRLSPSLSGVAIELGTWSPRADTPVSVLQKRMDVMRSVLDGLYAAVDSQPADAIIPMMADPVAGGLCLGAPASKPPLGSEFLAPVERVIQAVRTSGCGVTVLSLPVPAAHSSRIRSGLLGEIRAVQVAAHGETVSGPLVEQYLEILTEGLKMLTEGAAVGMWRTAVYLTGGDLLPQLVSTWQSVYASATSLFDPLMVLDWADAGLLAPMWAMPDVRGDVAPGLYRRPFKYQTLLTSRQLAAYVHLPEQELPGFSVRLLPAFDSVRAVVEHAGPGSADGRQRVVRIGTVLHRMQGTAQSYAVAPDDLSRHTLVCGVTGAGKTTTVLWLLRQLADLGVPYLVIEPIKTEYRILLTDQTPSPVRLFTAGNAMVLPLTINPFEVPVGTALAVHIDLLRALFTASFGMWAPMPQILERCIHEIYQDRGWSVLTGTNGRLDDDSDRSDSWPTLSDLADKVEEVIGNLGYSGEITTNIRSALSTRVDGLRAGAKGAMLDVASGTPADVLFDAPVVLELESLGADEDRAFVMGLLMLRLTEHRRRQGSSRTLRHVLVLEEAHRLLSRSVSPALPDQGDAKSKAVDAFVDMLAEIRSYGQAVIVADQVPVRLAPEVLKNTNLKIMQRTVAAADRSELAGTSAMNEDQSQVLATLERGQAAVFSEGDDAPLLVHIGPEAGNLAKIDATAPTDEQACELSGGEATALGGAGINTLPANRDGVVLGRSPMWRSSVTRFALCASSDVLAALEHRADLRALLGPSLTGDGIHDEACAAAAVAEAARWLSRRRGAQAGWSYTGERLYRVALQEALDAVCGSEPSPIAAQRVSALYDTSRQLLHRRHDPYPSCARICPTPEEATPVCLYRYAAADLLTGIPLSLPASVGHALTAWSDVGVGWAAAANTGVALVGQQARMQPRGLAARQAGLCAAQQALHRRHDLTPTNVLAATDSLLDVSATEPASPGGA